MSKNVYIIELIVWDSERDVDGNSGDALLPNLVCMSAFSRSTQLALQAIRYKSL